MEKIDKKLLFKLYLIDLENRFQEDSSTKNGRAIYSNRSAEQANGIISTIFRHSERMIRVFANDLNGEISENPNADNYYFESLSKYLSRTDTVLQVIIENKNPNSKLFRYLLERSEQLLTSDRQKRVEIKCASNEMKEELKLLRPPHYPPSGQDEVMHFITGDDRMFRLEYDSALHKASYSFNDEEVVKVLNSLFDKYFPKLSF